MPEHRTDNPDTPLPRLRPDLRFFAGPDDPDGSPTFTVFDPASGQYSKVGWAEAVVLQRLRPGMTLRRLLAELAAQTTLRLAPQDVLGLCSQAHQARMTVPRSAGSSVPILQQAEQRKKGPLAWLLANYLFLRIPLLHPDAFLRRSLPWMQPLASRAAFAIFAAVSLVGLALVTIHIETYINTFPHFFDWRGALAFAAVLTCVKGIHEFAHAYVARGLGVRVRSMGIALIVFWPVPFSDVTDAWRLKRRRDRFLIGVAGIAAELVLAGLSLFVWAVAPEGILQSAAFVVSSTTLISTLAVNLNPAMRYDGYYLLSDAWGIDNLRQRATDMTGWWLRTRLLGMDLGPPEERVHPRRLAGMIVYSLYAWTYRLGLYIAIAVVIYYKLAKALGVVLFAVEIGTFILRPLVREARALYAMRNRFSFNPRSIATLVVLAALLVWSVVPLRRGVHLPGAVVSRERQVVYAPTAGEVAPCRLKPNDRVRAGQVLLTLERESLATQLQVLACEQRILEAELNAMYEDEEGAELIGQRLEELAKVKAERAGLAETARQSRVRAQVTGMVAQWDETLARGRFVPAHMVLGEIVDPERVAVTAFAPEDHLEDVAAGDRVWFCPTGDVQQIEGRVVRVTPAHVDPMDYYGLTSMAGGDIPVVTDEAGDLAFLKTYFQVDIDLSGGRLRPQPGRLGTVTLYSKKRSRLLDFLRHTWSVVLRESGF